MTIEKNSPCKVNLLLNILGKRADGFHELETVMHPVNYCDRLILERARAGVELSCNKAELPVDGSNLVHRAATRFLADAGINEGVRIRLEKRIPMAAGLGGGSGNAASALLGLNELFGHPLSAGKLNSLATELGSDVPFFLQSKPALATGRGEKIEPLDAFSALNGTCFILIHPGFGIATSWAYQSLARFPDSQNGRAGRAQALIAELRQRSPISKGLGLYNALEAPAFEKFPILKLYQQFLFEQGATASLMSGSGSTTFAIVNGTGLAERIAESFKSRFGRHCWLEIVAV